MCSCNDPNCEGLHLRVPPGYYLKRIAIPDPETESKRNGIQILTVGLWLALVCLGMLGVANIHTPSKRAGVVMLISSIVTMYFPIKIASLIRRF